MGNNRKNSRDRNNARRTNHPHDMYQTLDERNNEIAGEITPDDVHEPIRSKVNAHEEYDHDRHYDDYSWFGWLAVALSVVAFFWMPIVLGAAGIILGIVARARDARKLGTVAIVIGIVAIITRMFLAPFI